MVSWVERQAAATTRLAEANNAANAACEELEREICRAYEDLVPITSIAAVTGWSRDRIRRHLIKSGTY